MSYRSFIFEGGTRWFHIKSATIYDKIAKILIAIIIYALICFILTKVFRKLDKRFDKPNTNKRMKNIILKTIEYTLDVFVLSLAIVQWVFVENAQIIHRIRIISWTEAYEWLHSKSESIIDYLLKVVLALTFYIIFSEVLGRLCKFIRNKLVAVKFSQNTIYILLKIINYTLRIFVVVVSVIQLFIVEYNMVAAFIVLALVAIAAGVKLKEFNFISIIEDTAFEELEIKSDKKLRKVADILNAVLYKIAGVVIILVIYIGIGRSISYLSSSGGTDITQYIGMTDLMMEKNLGTHFTENNSVAKRIPGLRNKDVKIKTNGELNLIYVNNKKVGVNTESRNYRFFDVGINQAEIKAVKGMEYTYEGYTQSVEDLTGGAASTYYYYNRKQNDCFAFTVNQNSNRIVSMTYYTNYDKVSEFLSID